MLCILRLGAIKHGLYCFARVVKCLLGAGAIAREKLEFGASLCVLGDAGGFVGEWLHHAASAGEGGEMVVVS